MGYNFLVEKPVKTRKRHRCIWCEEWMEVGEQAIYCKGLYDGDFYSYYLHPECRKAIDRDTEFDWCEGIGGERMGRGMTTQETGWAEGGEPCR